MTQGGLDFTDDQGARGCGRRKKPDGPESRRLHRAALNVLGRLQVGRATGFELMRAGGGMRFGARIHELRGQGHDVRIVDEDHDTGARVYALFVAGEEWTNSTGARP